MGESAYRQSTTMSTITAQRAAAARTAAAKAAAAKAAAAAAAARVVAAAPKPAAAAPKPAAPAAPKPLPKTTVVPGTPIAGSGQINVADYAAQLATNPGLALTRDNPATTGLNESMRMEDHVKGIDENAAGTNINAAAAKYAKSPMPGTAVDEAQAAAAAAVDPRAAETYDAALTQDAVAAEDMAAAQGEVSDESMVDAGVAEIDMQGTATGMNEDGSINWTGVALNEYANQDLDEVNSKATLKGQLEELQNDFFGPDGQPRIPPYAAAQARQVSKIAAFSGMTGTAAQAALATALYESSITVAEKDATFFQTLTLQNLNNKQQSIVNKASVLAKMDMVNADNRMAAAIQNSKNFMEMDLKNLDNRQQAQVINTQNRVQSILEDAKAKNTERMFTADSKNEMGKFYDQLNTQIEQFNTSQNNEMAKFNSSETNDMTQFKANLETQRDQFYKEMQYNIDVSNAKWRQTVTLTESQQKFDAAAIDVKNLVGISVEQMNQIWDRSDALLDYLWKSTESQLDRNHALAVSKLTAKQASDAASKAGFGSIVGSLVGAASGDFFDGFFDW